MIKRFLAWLKTIYFNPAPTEIQTPEVTTMSEPLVDTVVDAQPVVENVATDVQPGTGAAVTSPLDAEKSAFANFVAFVEHGIEKLGSEAEAELVALAKKYL